MSNRHYWPEPPKEDTALHLVEHRNGSITWCRLFPDGRWNKLEAEGHSKEQMISCGYLGVRKPFDEEDERAALLNKCRSLSSLGIAAMGYTFRGDEKSAKEQTAMIEAIQAEITAMIGEQA